MRLLLFIDVHCDYAAARRLVERSTGADVLVCAGDLAVMREGLQETVDIFSAVECPMVLVAGNGESDRELAAACAESANMHVLHGSGCEIDGVAFWGLGGAIPVTPFGAWSFDLSEREAEPLLTEAPGNGVLVTHSPPLGHVDVTAGGEHLGSESVRDAIERTQPRIAVCGHIHACWEQESAIGTTRVINAGPRGVWADV